MSDHIPTNFQALTPYLCIERPDEFIEFVTNAFGAEVCMNHREDGRLVHGELRIAGCMLELGQPKGDFTATKTNFHLYVPDADAVHAAAIEAGAALLYPVSDHEYGERSGGVRDAWGNGWFIATVTDKKKRST